jgi:hypothetical protein
MSVAHDDYSRRRTFKFRASVCLAASAICAFAGILGAVVHARLIAGGLFADAVVVGHDDGSTGHRRALVEFATAEGVVVRTHHPSHWSTEHPEVGEHVAIAYEAADPKRIGYATWRDEMKLILGMAGFAVIWAIPGARAFRQMRSIPRTTAKPWKRRGVPRS